MPPVLIAAAIGMAASAAAAASIITVTTALVITIAASAAAALLTKTSVPSLGAYTSQQERKQVLRSSTASQVVIYGKTVVSGTLFFAEEEQGDSSDGEWVHLAIALAGHAVHKVGTVWLGDDTIDTFGEYASYEVHNNRTTCDPFMLQNCPSWKEDMIGRNICWLRVSLKYNADKFPSGLPNITCEVWGKEVLDPRDNVKRWSDNAALCIMDYYRNECNVPDSDINTDQFIIAARISDQQAESAEGTYTRYTVNGAFDVTDAQSAVLDDLHKACAGEPTYMAGKHGLLVGAYNGPATMEIHEGQIISDVKIVPEAAYSEKLNTVTGTFLDPQQKYTEVDYPAVSVEEYIEKDGNIFSDDLKLRFVANEYQAQALAQIKINRTRIGRTITFTMNLSGYKYRPGYYVKLYLPSLGISGVEFRITEWAISATEGVDVTLRQETIAVWNGAIGQPLERPDLTDFPSATAPKPTNLTYEVMEIGEVVQGVLSWKNTGQVQYNIVYIRSAGKTIQSMQITGETTRISGLEKGEYELVVVAVTYLGTRSEEAGITVVIHAPDMPSGCDVEDGYFSVTLKPRTASVTSVATQFDFWTSGKTKLANANTATVEAGATRKGMGQLWTSEGLTLGDHYYWYIRSVNAFGASAFLMVDAVCNTDVQTLFEDLDDKIQNTDTYKELTSDITKVENNLTTATTHLNDVAEHLNTLETATVPAIRTDVDTLTTKTVPAIQASVNDVNTKATQTAKDLTTEATARANGDQQEASARAAALLTEKNERTAAIDNVSTTIQNVNESLSRQISQVSAGTGIQFDPINIWYFDTSDEGWKSRNGAVIVKDGWMRPANDSTDPYIFSSGNLKIDPTAYQYVKLRLRKVGNPTWVGALYWSYIGGSFVASQKMSKSVPIWDSNNTATIDFSDIPWVSADGKLLNAIRFNLTSTSSDTDYIEVDWVAVGRPTPGAGVAALQQEAEARTAADSAEAAERSTLATQLRGPYTGTDIANVSTGLLFSEKQARVSADQAEAVARQALETKVNNNKAAADQSISTLTTKQSAQATDITNLQTNLGKKADSTALSALDSKVTTQDNTITAQGQDITTLKTGLNNANTEIGKKASSEALNALSNVVTKNGNDIASNATDITNLQTTVNSINNVGDNLVLNYDFTNTLDQWATQNSPNISWGADSGDGKGGAVLTHTGGASYPGLFANKNRFTAVLPNRRYRAVIKAKGLSGSFNLMVRMWRKFDTGTENYVQQNLVFTDSWSVLTYDFTPVDNIIGVRFGVYCFPSVGSIAVDSIAVYDVTDAVSSSANASAIDTLNATVTQQGNSISSLATRATQLENGLSNTNKAVATKADATALQALQNTVTQQGDAITSGSNNLTQLANAIRNSLNDNLNFLANGSFEGDNFWTPANNTSLVTFLSAGGRKDGTAGCVQVKAGGIGAVYQNIQVTAGRLYLISCWTKCSSDCAVSDWNNTKLRIGNGTTGAILGAAQFNKGQLHTEWAQTTISYTPSTDLRFNIQLSGALSAGTILFDDVSVYDVTEANTLATQGAAISNLQNTVTQQGDSITSNAQSITSLNNSITDIKGQGNNLVLGGNFESYANANAPILRAFTTQAHSGAQCGQLTRTSATGSGGNNDVFWPRGLERDMFTVVGGQRLYFEFYAKRDAGETVAPSENTRFVFGLFTNSDTGGRAWTAGATVYTANLTTDNWTKFSGYLTAPSNAVKAQLWMSWQSNAENTQGVYALIDDIVLMDANEAAKVQANLDVVSTAVSKLDSKVTQQGDTITSQGQSITTLNNSVSTAQKDATAAQTAAQNAATLAGSKGEVIYGSTAPAVDKRLSQNIWIDTTNNANTPKRWNGSAWVAVTDKVATDAAAAAAAAQTTANAAASGVQSLQNTVKTQGDMIDSQTSDITNLSNTLNSSRDAKTNMVSNFDFRNGLNMWRLENPTPGNRIVWDAASGESGAGVTMTRSEAVNPAIHVNNGEYWPVRAGARVRVQVRAKGLDGTFNLMCRLYRKSNDGTTTSYDRPMLFTADWSTVSFDYPALGTDIAAIALRVYMFPSNGKVVISSVVMYDVTDALLSTANSSAIESLDSRVTQAGTDITSQAASIVQLKNSVNTLETGKADASAVQTLQQTVNQQGTTLTSQSANITKLNNSVSALQGQGSNMLLDGGFESFTGTGALSATTDNPRTGSQCARFTRTAATANGNNNDAVYESSGFATRNAQEFYLEAWVRKDPAMTVTPGSGAYFRFGLWGLSSSNGNMWNVAFDVAYSQLTDTYQKFSGYVKLNSSAVKARLWLAIPSNANNIYGMSCLIDDIVLMDATEARLVQSNVDAVATAVQTLDNKVTTQGNTLTSQGNAITQLNNSVSTLNSGKADVTALNALQTKVTQQDGTLTTQGTAITSLNSTLAGLTEQGDNLVVNPRFLNGTDYWTITPYAGNSIVWGADTGDGKAGLVITRNNANNPYINTPPSGKYWQVLPSRKYRVSVRAKGLSGANNVMFRLYKISQAGAQSTQDAQFTFSGTNFETKTFDYNQTAADCSQLFLRMYCYPSNAVVAIDSISIYDVTDSLANSANATAINDVQTKVVQQGADITAQSTRIDQLTTRVGDAETSVNNSFEAIATIGLAQTNGFMSQRAAIASNVAEVSQLTYTMATETEALAKRIDTVSATVNDMSATVQETATAAADANGKLSAMWGVKVVVDSNGIKRVGGIQLGVSEDGGSQFIVDADTFAVYNRNAEGGRMLAFANDGVNTFIRTALIQDASIDSAKIKDGAITNAKVGDLRSTNYSEASQGWRFDKNGNLEINGSAPGQGRYTLNNTRQDFYDASGNLVVRIGKLR